MNQKICLLIISTFILVSGQQKLIPGIEQSAYGYNVFKGDPNAAVNDPGVSHSIYKISYLQDKKIGDYSIPDFMSVTRNIRCSRYSSSIQDAGMTSYQQSLALTAGITLDVQFLGSFSTSVNFQQKQQESQEYEYTYITSEANCQIYSGQWESFLNVTLTDNFISAVELTDFNNEESIYSFIDHFGTHLQSQTSIGAMTQRISSVTAENIELMMSLNIDVKAAASGNFDFVNGKVQTETSLEKENRQYFNQTIKQRSELSIGAKMPSPGSDLHWQDLVENDITSIRFKLGDTIDSLLTSKNFPNDDDIQSKQFALKNSYSQYCSIHLQDCKVPDADPSLIFAQDQLDVQYGTYGKMLYCDSGNSIVGTCGSGQEADCNNAFHKEMCSTGMKYEFSTQHLNSAGYGEWSYCNSGSIISLCRSGKYADCGDSQYFIQMGCAYEIPVMKTSCTQVMGWYGEDIYCPDGYVANGSCGSGWQPDCKGWDGQYHYTGLYCCPIGNKNNGEPKWILPYEDGEALHTEEKNFLEGQ